MHRPSTLLSGTASLIGAITVSACGGGPSSGAQPQSSIDGSIVSHGDAAAADSAPCPSCGDATMPRGDGGAPAFDAQGSTSDAGSGGSDAPIPDGSSHSCHANCTGKTCGDDGCGGTCGGCPPTQLCSASNACQTPSTTGIVIDAKSQLATISPAIYGVALTSDDSTKIATLNRWGGDSTGSYNWKNDIFNTGTDWNCANYQGLFTSPSPSPAYTTSADQFVHYNKTKNLDSLMTIPISGWLGDSLTQNDSAHSSCSGSTQNTTPCCTGIAASESTLVDKGSKNLDTSYLSQWVQHLVSTFGDAANGGVHYYQLDNEPDNWQALRRDIYPSLYPPGTFCESFYSTIPQVGTSISQDFVNRTMAYAAAVKGADPTSYLLFMVVENPADLVSIDSIECGGAGSPYTLGNSLTSAILTLGAQHEASTGQRILDCVDMHYPVSGTALTATNVLWDTTTSSVFPHVQGWINAAYPGTGICVSEYNWSGDGTNGSAANPATATLEADLLGMYGRLGVRLAAYWTTLVYQTTHLPVYSAMAMYRNYDGAGGHFGSYSVGAASSNASVHVYASADSAPGPTKLWIMPVNVSTTAQSNLTITIGNFTTGATAQVYRMTGGAPPAADTSATISGGKITGVLLPAGDAALFVVPN